jgi:CBS domain containing-hemolysin-like protein
VAALGPGVWLVEGAASIEQVNAETGASLSAEGADRIAGWVAYHAGGLLKAGESVAAQGHCATVRRLRSHRLEQLQLERLPEGGSGEEGGRPA